MPPPPPPPPIHHHHPHGAHHGDGKVASALHKISPSHRLDVAKKLGIEKYSPSHWLASAIGGAWDVPGPWNGWGGYPPWPSYGWGQEARWPY